MTTGYWNRSTASLDHDKSWNGGNGRDSENSYTMNTLAGAKPSWENRTATSGWMPCTRSTFGIAPPAASSAYWGDLQTKTLKRLMGKYKQHDFNLGTFLGELPETAEAVASAGLSIFKAYREVRKGRFHKAVSVLRKANIEKGRTFTVDKTSSSAWLALQMGWLPLIGDAYSAADAFQKGAARPKVTKIRSHSTYKRPVKTGGTTPGGLKYVDKLMETYTKRVILKTVYQPSVYEQLGLTNPALIAWEILPFSFLVDYFVGIADYLELHTVLPNKSSLYVNTQFFRSELNGIKSNPLSGRWFKPEYISCRVNTVSLTRSITGNPVIPLPRIKNPFLKLTKLANMVALGVALTR